MRSQVGHVLCKGRRRGPSSPVPVPTPADLIGVLGERLSGKAEGLLATRLTPPTPAHGASQEGFGLGRPLYRGRRRASADQGDVLVARVSTKEHSLVPGGEEPVRVGGTARPPPLSHGPDVG